MLTLSFIFYRKREIYLSFILFELLLLYVIAIYHYGGKRGIYEIYERFTIIFQ